jgi:sulfhydrogenase subunit beta (sulfur reductase)
MFHLTLGSLSVTLLPLDKYLLSTAQRDQWLSKLLEKFAVYIPVEREAQVHWHRLEPADMTAGTDTITPALRRIRASEPVKSFMFNPRQQVGAFPDKLDPVEPKVRVLLGVKNCDLVPLKVHDKILGDGEFSDPFYAAQRKNTILVAADCPVPEESCFCNLLGLTPFAGDSADAVLSVSDGAYLLEVGERGKELVSAAPDLFRKAGEGDAGVAKRDEERKAAVAALSRINPKPWNPDLPAAVAAKRKDESFWRKHAEKCVECFGCLMGCPTCYCYLLYDQAREKGLDRTRVWDACYLAAYARVGGGANPRAEFVKRFANRFICKFSDFKTDHGIFSCSGCGRCFKSCMGKIDIRKVLAEL